MKEYTIVFEMESWDLSKKAERRVWALLDQLYEASKYKKSCMVICAQDNIWTVHIQGKHTHAINVYNTLKNNHIKVLTFREECYIIAS